MILPLSFLPVLLRVCVILVMVGIRAGSEIGCVVCCRGIVFCHYCGIAFVVDWWSHHLHDCRMRGVISCSALLDAQG